MATEEIQRDNEALLAYMPVSARIIREQLAMLHDLPANKRHALRELMLLHIASLSAPVRAECAVGLGRIGDDRAVPLLLWASSDPVPLVRWQAVYALRSLCERVLVPAHTVAFEDGPAFEHWKIDIVQEIAQELQSPDVAVRFAAVDTIAEIETPLSIRFLFAVLADEEAPLRWEAGSALFKIVAANSETRFDVADRLIDMLGDADKVVRSSAADILGRLGVSGAIPSLLPLLHDADPAMRLSVCEALGRVGNEQLAGALATSLADDDPWIRRAAALALRSIRGHSAQAVLMRVVDDEHPLVRRAIFAALAEVGDDTVIDVLIAALTDSDREVALAAIAGLRRLGGKRSLLALGRLRRGRLSHEASQAIRTIRKQSAVAENTYRRVMHIS